MPTYNVFKKNKEEVIKGKDLKEALKKSGDKTPSKVTIVKKGNIETIEHIERKSDKEE